MAFLSFALLCCWFVSETMLKGGVTAFNFCIHKGVTHPLNTIFEDKCNRCMCREFGVGTAHCTNVKCNRLVIDPPLCKHNCIGHKNTPADQEEEEPEDNNVKLLIKPGLESSGNEIEVEAETLDNEIRVKTKPQESPMKHKSESLENGVRLEPKAPESEVRNEPKTAGNKVKKERDSMENEILGLLLASENEQKVKTVENQKKPERQNTGTKKEVHLTLTGAGNKKGVDIITRNTTKSSIEEEGGRRETNRANRYRGSKNNNNRANKELKNRLDKLLGTGGKVNG